MRDTAAGRDITRVQNDLEKLLIVTSLCCTKNKPSLYIRNISPRAQRDWTRAKIRPFEYRTLFFENFTINSSPGRPKPPFYGCLRVRRGPRQAVKRSIRPESFTIFFVQTLDSNLEMQHPPVKVKKNASRTILYCDSLYGILYVTYVCTM